MNDQIFHHGQRNIFQKQMKQTSQFRSIEIDNYYGAHKNFKTDFRNKKYKNVYIQLIHRKPSQPQHRYLYNQDILISIIKSIELSFTGKDNISEPIQPFFYFGTKTINEFYWLFLKERRIIDRELVIDPTMKNKISNFFTLLIDFACKIAQFLALKGDNQNSQKIFSAAYKEIVVQIIESSTSNLLLLKKCGQFLLHYAMHCLNTQNYEKANHILKNGLKTQLNQLILLKYNLLYKKNDKKFAKKYSAILKILGQFYLSFALLYEKTNRMYQCSVAVLDAVLIEELICFYNSKCKKWVWNLQSSYVEEKSKHLELMRICSTFFALDSLKNVNPRFNLGANGTFQDINFYAKNQDDFTKSIRSMKTNKNHEQLKANKIENGKESMNQKVNQNENKKIFIKATKEVRFKLVAESEDREQKNTNRDKQGTRSQNSDQTFNQMLKTEQSFDKVHLDELMKAKDLIYKFPDKRNNGSRRTSLRSMKNNDAFLFGENFWTVGEKDAKRTKSSFEKVYNRQELEIKKPGRKLSYNNVAYIEVPSSKNMKNNMEKYLNSFCKDKKQALKKKRKRNSSLFMKQKEQNPDNEQKIKEKIQNWHNKNLQIDTDVLLKVNKLRQKKNTKNGVEKLFYSEKLQTQISLQEQNKDIKLSQLENQLSIRKFKEIKKEKERRPGGGVRLFKMFLLENKNFFNISKLQLFNYSIQTENQKRCASFSEMEAERTQKNIEKNYIQAKNNLQFFTRQIQNANKRLEKPKPQRKHFEKQKKPSKYQDKRALQPIIQNIEYTQSLPSNLFATSLRTRVAQMINYY